MDKVFFGSDILRFVIALFDRAAYGLLKEVYILFFNVATAEIINGAFIAKFFARIQLIIGIFMMFQLALTIVKGIMNPNSFTDEKAGAGNLITRIVVALVLLTLLVPINIAAPANEYEKQLNNNGLLFGTLYSLQNRILRQNTLGRLILGTDAENYTSLSPDTSSMESLKKTANRFATTVLRTFITFNTINDGDDPTKVENRVCQSIDNDIFETYTDPETAPNELINLVNEKCTPSIGVEEYIFELKVPIVDSIVGFVFVWLILAMTFEVAVRAIKLVVLRLIAPIPIISYMDPKGSKDSAFTSWTKLLTSTYLSLFIKLAVIYFVMSIVNDMLTNGVIITTTGSKFLQGLTAIIIWIGLFIFAKESDKFIKQALGLKDNGAKFFANFGAAMGIGKGAIAGVAGVASGAVSGWRGSYESQKARYIAEHGSLDGFRANIGSQIATAILRGGISAYRGANGVYTDKEHHLMSGLNASAKSNSAWAGYAADGASLGGKVGAFFQRGFTGETGAERTERDLKSLESRRKSADELVKFSDGELMKHDWTRGDVSTNIGGRDLSLRVNYKNLMQRKNAAAAAGQSSFDIEDWSAGGNTPIMRNITMTEAEAIEADAKKYNSSYFISKRGTKDSNVSNSEFEKFAQEYENLNGQKISTDEANARGIVKDQISDIDKEITKKKSKFGVQKANSDATKPK